MIYNLTIKITSQKKLYALEQAVSQLVGATFCLSLFFFTHIPKGSFFQLKTYIEPVETNQTVVQHVEQDALTQSYLLSEFNVIFLCMHSGGGSVVHLETN